MVVWDAFSGQPIAALDDPWQSATGRRGEAGVKSSGVKALAWILSDPSLLVIALSNLLVVWDPRGISSSWLILPSDLSPQMMLLP